MQSTLHLDEQREREEERERVSVMERYIEKEETKIILFVPVTG